MPQESQHKTPGSAPGPRRKRRRRRKRMNPVLYILLVVSISAILAAVGWILAGDVLALNKAPHSATITLSNDIFTYSEETSEVKRNDGTVEKVTKTVGEADMEHVAELLKKEGLIEYKPLFKLFSSVSHASRKLSPGTYELNTDMDYNALINSMSARSGSRMTVSVTIPEGYTIDQIFALLQEKGVSTQEILQNVAANHDFKYSFLQGVLPLGDYHRLEGYLFPDTYEFYMGGGESAAIQVLNKMILRFDERFSDSLRQKAAEMGYTIHEIVTIASLIEKETDGGDQAHIASVIYNRLDHPDYETAGYLQIDASIAYVTGQAVTQADYQKVDSPYNTYRSKGLPPGPIANPGMVALNSALNPDRTGDYYYVLGTGDDGKPRHYYARTSAEFERLKASLNG